LLKLPVCPHCNAVYSYREVKNMKQGICFCYHCEKKFYVSKVKGAALLLVIICTLLIAANTAVMVSSENFVPAAIMIADAVVITAAILIMPLTVRFRPLKLSKAEKREMTKGSGNKKNRNTNTNGKK